MFNALKTARTPLVAGMLLAMASVTVVPAQAASLQTDVARHSANIGWATQNGGTTGGKSADRNHIFLVNNISDLKNALKHAKSSPSIIQIRGTIDVSHNKPYKNHRDQDKRSQLEVPSNTTIIGVNGSAGIVNGSLVMEGVHNIIIRNISIETPVDVDPQYESGDGWNANWDSMTIRNSHNIWVDHVNFNDGSFTDNQYGTRNGEEFVQHDGMLDITHGSDFVTVSYSWFRNHDKTMLIGHSRHNSSEDKGHLRVTLADNIFDMIRQRAPRVRFGKVHAFNNVYKGDKKSNRTYRYSYTYGMGEQGSIISENNAWEISNMKSNKRCEVFKVYRSNSSLSDSGSLYNGSSINLSSHCDLPGRPNWNIPYSYKLRSARDLDGHLAQHTGANHMKL